MSDAVAKSIIGFAGSDQGSRIFDKVQDDVNSTAKLTLRAMSTVIVSWSVQRVASDIIAIAINVIQAIRTYNSTTLIVTTTKENEKENKNTKKIKNTTL